MIGRWQRLCRVDAPAFWMVAVLAYVVGIMVGWHEAGRPLWIGP